MVFKLVTIADKASHDLLNLSFSNAWGSAGKPHLEVTIAGGSPWPAGSVVELEIWRHDITKTSVGKQLVLGREVWQVGSVTFQATASPLMGNSVVTFDSLGSRLVTATLQEKYDASIPAMPVPPKFASVQEADDWMAKHEQSARKHLNSLED